MKEYKLSAKSKYSVCYLLCGLFMFFFMFAILSLNSHASAVSDYVLNITSSNGTFFETSGLYHSFSGSLQHPEYAYPITTVSGSSSFTRPSNVESVNLEVHVVTSEGDFVVDTHQGTGSYESFSSVKLQGYPIGYYGVCKGYLKEGTSSTTMTMNVSCSASVSNQTTNVTSSLSDIQRDTSSILSYLGQDSDIQYDNFNFSDYSSFSPLNTSSVVKSKPNFGGKFFPSGCAINFTFLDVTQPSQGVFESYICFSDYGSGDYIFYYSILSTSSTLDLEHIYLGLVCDGVNYTFSQNQFTLVSSTHLDSTTYQYTYSVSVSVPYKDGVRNCFLLPYFPYSGVTGISFSGYKIKGTISDYMEFVKNNYDTINPSVIDTNTNITQTVSDIGTVKLSEGQVFTDFDSLTSTSGFDSFSLTSVTSVAAAMNFLSTCIVNVFNGMPSGFRWLIQAIGCIGIISLLLNVFGRVGQRMHMDRVESERLSILRSKHSGGN